MVNPVDLQTVIVRGVDVSSTVSQQVNAQIALAHLTNVQMIQKTEQQLRTVNPREGVEQKTIGSSTEERSSSSFYRPRARRNVSAQDLREGEKGTILDVRL
ncbi:MAG: hypothetical protein H5T93_07025 [Pseudothermotoga sp.]|uniref:hypothetical protein n=1 Tax=Pseudothermotoga sp. TaxID=2033661 RepID=UPI000AE2E45C|nr:hypothetical protein [Pseudothermotoga sp.]HBT39599.1 hypothetical protein [Pseudothermotoga sp.]HCO98765.1 hypothetical protein [Pseudothermotoga sp.]